MVKIKIEFLIDVCDGDAFNHLNWRLDRRCTYAPHARE